MLYVFLALALLSGCALTYAASGFASLAAVWQVPVFFLGSFLALVVLFTLANTNVSERVREMATLKVLGFFDREVHHYVNREMMILTVMGVILGLPLGRLVGGMLTMAQHALVVFRGGGQAAELRDRGRGDHGLRAARAAVRQPRPRPHRPHQLPQVRGVAPLRSPLSSSGSGSCGGVGW